MQYAVNRVAKDSLLEDERWRITARHTCVDRGSEYGVAVYPQQRHEGKRATFIIKKLRLFSCHCAHLSLSLHNRMKRDKIIERIKNLAMSTLPAGSSLFLYGSQARGDARIGSDWDLLILLDKPKLEAGDYGVAYPFRELGWEIGEEINPSVYTRQQWASWSFLPSQQECGT